MTKHLLAAVSITALAAVSAPAIAQDAQGEQSAANGAPTEGLIVVTATRREGSLQDAPLAVTALGKEAMEERSIASVEDVGNLTAGVQIARYQGDTSIFIRGIGTPSIIAGNDSSTAAYLNGTYLSRAAAIGPAFFDVQRVEVLRGPQGTLYGRNATGGAINIVTQTPGDSLEGDARLTLGNFDLVRFSGGVGGPLSEGLRARLAVQAETRGGFVVGSKDAPVSDGTEFARSGVVCVAINYRMGIDGFLPIAGVPTNLGLRDMLFALQWVQDNVATFGGDPANVTVFGESAGAMAIADLVTSPMAKGLFRRAIIQSGHGAMVRDIGVAQRLVTKLAKKLGVPPTAEGFRDVTFEAGWSAMEKLAKPWSVDLRDDQGHEPVFGISRFIPVWGDDVLPRKPIDALREGAGRDVEVLIGSNAEEMNLYFVPTGIRRRIPGFLARWLVSRSIPNAREVLKAYGLGKKGVRAGEAMTLALSDLVFRWPARQFAEAHQGKTWTYEMDWQSPACGGELGACHAIDVPFVFNTLECASGPHGIAGEAPPQALADHIHEIWAGFARDGVLPWPQWDADRVVYQLEARAPLAEAPMPAAQFLPD